MDASFLRPLWADVKSISSVHGDKSMNIHKSWINFCGFWKELSEEHPELAMTDTEPLAIIEETIEDVLGGFELEPAKNSIGWNFMWNFEDDFNPTPEEEMEQIEWSHPLLDCLNNSIDEWAKGVSEAIASKTDVPCVVEWMNIFREVNIGNLLLTKIEIYKYNPNFGYRIRTEIESEREYMFRFNTRFDVSFVGTVEDFLVDFEPYLEFKLESDDEITEDLEMWIGNEVNFIRYHHMKSSDNLRKSFDLVRWAIDSFEDNIGDQPREEAIESAISTLGSVNTSVLMNILEN